MRNRLVRVVLVGCFIGIFPGGSALAQQQTPRVEFEAAFIKPAAAGAQGNFFEIPPRGERFTATNAPLRVLIMMAYGVADWRVSGGPGWMNSKYFDIEAKPERPSSRELIFQMLRNLLSDRFQLKLHKETKEAPLYILAKTEKAFGLRENRSGDNPRVEKGERGQILFRSFPMAQFARYLSLRLRNEVADKTMLTGSFDFELLFASDTPSPNDIVDSIQDQVGLRLQFQETVAEVLIIDSAAQPSEN